MRHKTHAPLFSCLPELDDNVASSPILHVLGRVQEFLHLQLWLIYMRCFSNLQIHYHRHGHTILLLYRKAVLLGYMLLYRRHILHMPQSSNHIDFSHFESLFYPLCWIPCISTTGCHPPSQCTCSCRCIGLGGGSRWC